MNLQERINEDLKTAMRGNDTLTRDVLRLLNAAIKEANNQRRAAQFDKLAKSGQINSSDENAAVARIELQPMNDAEVLDVIKKQVKQRRDSIDAYVKGQRPELARKEEEELSVLQRYLPQQMSRAELQTITQEVIAALGARTPADMGKVMAAMRERVGDRAEGREISAVVREQLSRA